jgi:hypothetical protein
MVEGVGAGEKDLTLVGLGVTDDQFRRFLWTHPAHQ